MKKFHLILVLWIGVVGCGNSQTEKLSINEAKESDRENMALLTIDEESVVIFRPNSAEIDSLKEVKGEDFYTIADDANFYSSQAYELLERRHVKEVVTKERFIQFKKSNGQTIVLDKNRLQSSWGAILFQPNKDPKEVPLVDLGIEMDEYFE